MATVRVKNLAPPEGIYEIKIKFIDEVTVRGGIDSLPRINAIINSGPYEGFSVSCLGNEKHFTQLLDKEINVDDEFDDKELIGKVVNARLKRNGNFANIDEFLHDHENQDEEVF